MGDSRTKLPARLRVQWGAVLALLLAAACAFPAPAAATQDLTGVWLKSRYTLAAFQLQTSAGGTKLSATWGVVVGLRSEGLAGRFTGTLNQSGTAYTGPMSVSVGSISVNGTMTVALGPDQKFGYPVLDVSYYQNNGVTATFTLQRWLSRPRVTSNPNPAITFLFDCPGPQACRYTAQAGSFARTQFTVGAGQSRTIKLSPNKNARQLLATRHVLRAPLVVTADRQSAPTPYRTALGTVTLRPPTAATRRAAPAARHLPVGTDGLGVYARVSRGRAVITFARQAADIYAQIARHRVYVSCTILLETVATGYATSTTSTGQLLTAPRRRGSLSVGVGRGRFDLCTVTRGGSELAVIPVTGIGANYLDELQTARNVLGTAAQVAAVPPRRPPSAGHMRRVTGGRIVGLAGPTRLPPAGHIGYWTDGRTTIYVVERTFYGVPFFYIENLDSGLVVTNLTGWMSGQV